MVIKLRSWMSGSKDGVYADAMNVGELVVCKNSLQRIGHYGGNAGDSSASEDQSLRSLTQC